MAVRYAKERARRAWQELLSASVAWLEPDQLGVARAARRDFGEQVVAARGFDTMRFVG